MEIMLIAIASLCYLSYAVYSWVIGRRERSVYYLETLVNMIVMFLLVKAIFTFSSNVINNILGGSVGISTIPSSRSLENITDYFSSLHEYAVAWITYIAMTRTVIALTPFVSSLSQVIGSATEWAVYELNIVATVTMALTIFSRVFITLMDYILFFGTLLTPIPHFRKIGSTLFSIYIVIGSLLFVIGDFALSTQASLRNQGLEPPRSDIEYLLRSVNVLEWRTIIDKVAKVAWIMLDFVVKATFASVLAGIILVGFSIALGGIYTWIQPF